MLRVSDLLLTLAAVFLLLAAMDLKPRGGIIKASAQQTNSSLANMQQPPYAAAPFVPQLPNFLNPFAAFQLPQQQPLAFNGNNHRNTINNDNPVNRPPQQQPLNPLQALYEQLPIYQNLLAARQRQEAFEAAQRARLQHQNRLNQQQQQQQRRNSSPRPRTTTTTTTTTTAEPVHENEQPEMPQQQPQQPTPMAPIQPNGYQMPNQLTQLQPPFNPFAMQALGQPPALGQQQQQPPQIPANAIQLQQLYQQLMAARQSGGQPIGGQLPGQLQAQLPVAAQQPANQGSLGGFDPQRAFAAAGIQQPLNNNNLLALLQQQQLQQQLQQQQLQQQQLQPQLPPIQQPPQVQPPISQQPPQTQSNANVQFDDENDKKEEPEKSNQQDDNNQPANEQPEDEQDQGNNNDNSNQDTGHSADQNQPHDHSSSQAGNQQEANNQQDSAKPEEEDPDLKQFQNLANGGDSFTDLFPPGILSNNDITDIRRQQEEQAKKQEQEERQRYLQQQQQQQRQQQQNNQQPTNNFNAEDGSEENNDQNQDQNGEQEQQQQPPSQDQDQDQEQDQNLGPTAAALTAKPADKAPSERLTSSPGVIYSRKP